MSGFCVVVVAVVVVVVVVVVPHLRCSLVASTKCGDALHGFVENRSYQHDIPLVIVGTHIYVCLSTPVYACIACSLTCKYVATQTFTATMRAIFLSSLLVCMLTILHRHTFSFRSPHPSFDVGSGRSHLSVCPRLCADGSLLSAEKNVTPMLSRLNFQARVHVTFVETAILPPMPLLLLAVTRPRR